MSRKARGWPESSPFGRTGPLSGGRRSMSGPVSRHSPTLSLAALQELPQHPLDHRAKRPVLPHEARRPHPQQLLEVLLDQAKQRRLARPPRLVDPTADLHTSRPAGGRASGENGRGSVPSRPAPSGRVPVSTAGESGRVRSCPRASRCGIAASRPTSPAS